MKKLQQKTVTRNVWIGIAVAFCLLPFVTPGIALAGGIILSQFGIQNKRWQRSSSFLLKVSVVLLGFGVHLATVVEVSQSSFGLTAFSVCFTLLTGVTLGYLFKVKSKTTWLVAVGTAICGGSAIAAAAPVIGADQEDVTFSLIVVFVLNAIALFIFPALGNWMHLDQITFGYWSAIAIHDTSSVIGAGAAYGKEALEIATIVKLTRALWIIPVAFVLLLINGSNGKKSITIPWFIFLFLAVILLVYWVPSLNIVANIMVAIGKRGLIIALFFIGNSISAEAIKESGSRIFLLGVCLWILVAVSSLFSLLVFNIS